MRNFTIISTEHSTPAPMPEAPKAKTASTDESMAWLSNMFKEKRERIKDEPKQEEAKPAPVTRQPWDHVRQQMQVQEAVIVTPPTPAPAPTIHARSSEVIGRYIERINTENREIEQREVQQHAPVRRFRTPAFADCKVMKAKYRGECPETGNAINESAFMLYDMENRQAFHVESSTFKAYAQFIKLLAGI